LKPNNGHQIENSAVIIMQFVKKQFNCAFRTQWKQSNLTGTVPTETPVSYGTLIKSQTYDMCEHNWIISFLQNLRTSPNSFLHNWCANNFIDTTTIKRNSADL